MTQDRLLSFPYIVISSTKWPESNLLPSEILTKVAVQPSHYQLLLKVDKLAQT